MNSRIFLPLEELGVFQAWFWLVNLVGVMKMFSSSGVDPSLFSSICNSEPFCRKVIPNIRAPWSPPLGIVLLIMHSCHNRTMLLILGDRALRLTTKFLGAGSLDSKVSMTSYLSIAITLFLKLFYGLFSDTFL